MAPNALPFLANELNALWPASISLLRDLIRLHPVYGAQSQLNAVLRVREFLTSECGAAFEVYEYSARSLVAEAGYVNVAAFDPALSTDVDIHKYSLLGIVE